MANRRLTSSRVGAPRKDKEWAATTVDLSGFTTVQDIDLLSTYRSLAGEVTRVTVKSIYWQLNGGVATGTGGYATGCFIGIIKGDRAGTAATLPDPETNPSQDWIINKRYFFNASNGGATNGSHAADDAVHTGRKLDAIGETYWLCVKPFLGGATTLNLTGLVRTLLWVS